MLDRVRGGLRVLARRPCTLVAGHARQRVDVAATGGGGAGDQRRALVAADERVLHPRAPISDALDHAGDLRQGAAVAAVRVVAAAASGEPFPLVLTEPCARRTPRLRVGEQQAAEAE